MNNFANKKLQLNNDKRRYEKIKMINLLLICHVFLRKKWNGKFE